MRNLVVVCLDTVRKDAFDEHATRLQEMADVSFEQCRAASSWSAPSHASMLTGELPHEHGVHAHNRDFSGLSRADTFLGDLPDHRAVGASANVWASSAFGFDGVFDAFSDVSPDRRFPDGIDVARFGQECDAEGLARHAAFLRAALAHDHPVRSLLNGALVEVDDLLARAPVPKPMDDGAGVLLREATRLVEDGPEPFVLFVNFMDAHGPLRHVRGYDRNLHDAPLSWTSERVDWTGPVDPGSTAVRRYRGLYAAAVDYLDRRVAPFVEDLRERTDRGTTIVVTADHGDNLAAAADDGHWGHVESTLTEGLLHVPCCVVGAPDDAPATVREYFSHLDLRPLSAALARGEWPSVGSDAIPAERVGHSGRADRAASADPADDRMLRAVYRDDSVVVWESAGGCRAFDLDPDRPCWRAEVGECDGPPADADRWFDGDAAAYKQRAAAGDAGPDVDDAVADRLAELGYL